MAHTNERKEKLSQTEEDGDSSELEEGELRDSSDEYSEVQPVSGSNIQKSKWYAETNNKLTDKHQLINKTPESYLSQSVHEKKSAFNKWEIIPKTSKSEATFKSDRIQTICKNEIRTKFTKNQTGIKFESELKSKSNKSEKKSKDNDFDFFKSKSSKYKKKDKNESKSKTKSKTPSKSDKSEAQSKLEKKKIKYKYSEKEIRSKGENETKSKYDNVTKLKYDENKLNLTSEKQKIKSDSYKTEALSMFAKREIESQSNIDEIKSTCSRNKTNIKSNINKEKSKFNEKELKSHKSDSLSKFSKSKIKNESISKLGDNEKIYKSSDNKNTSKSNTNDIICKFSDSEFFSKFSNNQHNFKSNNKTIYKSSENTNNCGEIETISKCSKTENTFKNKKIIFKLDTEAISTCNIEAVPARLDNEILKYKENEAIKSDKGENIDKCYKNGKDSKSETDSKCDKKEKSEIDKNEIKANDISIAKYISDKNENQKECDISETKIEFNECVKNETFTISSEHDKCSELDKSATKTEDKCEVKTACNVQAESDDDSLIKIEYDGSDIDVDLEVEINKECEGSENNEKCKELEMGEESKPNISDQVMECDNNKADDDDDDVDKHENEKAGTNKPPLMMQSSNLPSVDRLDNRHDRGGLETSNDENIEPPKKKQKTDASDDDGDTFVDCNLRNSDDDFDDSESNSKNITLCAYEDYNDDQMSFQNGVMAFDILDEFESNDNENDEICEDYDSDISLSELDELLDASLQNNKLSLENGIKPDENEIEEKQKVILKVRGSNPFDVLPEGWIEVTHNSGMPIYLHKATRVCSVSKPYFLGPGSTRKHEIPVSAIPCLHYLRELEKEKNQANEQNNNPTETFPPAKLESVKDAKESGSLDYLAVREYCKKRFEFQTITIKRFKTWSGRRNYMKELRQRQRPTLPDSTKLITCPLPATDDKNNSTGHNSKKEFILNPCGKSPICILHEYVQHTLRVQPKYIFKELENASTPYGAVVVIEDMEYGSGYGSSKKQAKCEAARAALDILFPKMKMFTSGDFSEDDQDLEFFDQVRVEDPRVCELSIKAGQPYPYQILLECLKRNYGMGDTEIEFKMRNLKHQKNEFIMTVGKHTVSVICKNKRDGKHRASQAILQLLHPHITSWGSLLRMYGKGSCKTLKEKKEEEQRITELQSQACANKPNTSILNKLKSEMLKYRERMKLKKPIGKLIPEQLNLSISDSNLKNVEL